MKEIIIIGAGILGSSAAYHLAKLGAKVTIIDRQDKGQATYAAAGIVCPWISQRRNKAWYELVKNGAKYYPSLIEDLKDMGEVNTGYKQVGAISLHNDLEKLEKMAERTRKRKDDAPEIGEISILTPSETRALFPPVAPEFGSVYISGGARVNGASLRNALLLAAQKYGAKLIYGDALLEYNGTNVFGVRLREQIITSDQVIVTSGAWGRELLQPLNINFLVKPQKAQIIHLELPATHTSNWPVVMPPNDQYILAFGDSRVVIGATHEDEAGFDDRITAGGVHEVLSKALAIAPGLVNGTIIETRVGFRPFTPGFLPVIGKVQGYEGILVANGLGASGLTAGPYLGAELAKLSLSIQTELNLENYNVSGAIEQT